MSSIEEISAGASREVWGVLGGAGPLASAEFLASIYGMRKHINAEQDLPIVLLLSDPSIPDRTSALFEGRASSLLVHAQTALEKLDAAGATRLLMCCVTLHAVLPKLPVSLRGKIISLIDLAIEGIGSVDQRLLMLCSAGSRRSAIFESHSGWREVESRVIFPSAVDQDGVHQVIYALKSSRYTLEHASFISCLCQRYKARSYVAGCTEIHMLSRRWKHALSDFCVDPLQIAAQMIGSGIAIAKNQVRANEYEMGAKEVGIPTAL